jgi:hypothetical protein
MKISKGKIDKIKENILAILYSKSPQAIFTADIANETARDEEFMKKLLLEMEKEKLIFAIKKNNNGIKYLRRIRWRLSSQIFEAYDKISKQKIEYDDKNHTYSY